MLAKNQINRNKLDNKAKSDNKNLDFMLLIQNNINGHIEWEYNFNLIFIFCYIKNENIYDIMIINNKKEIEK